jgi:ABC-type amino acid transport substrate-binding protein
MKRILTVLLSLAMLLSAAAAAVAETTLEKINRTGVLTIGTRTGVPPFAD